MQAPTREFVEDALKATGMTLEDLAERLDYKSLRRAMYGEIPLPESKRKHITDIVALARLSRAEDTTLGSRTSDEPIRLDGREPYGNSPSPREKLKAARERAGLSVKELAKKTGYPIGVLQAIEDAGARLTEKHAEKLVAVLPGLTMEDLCDGSDSPRIIPMDGLVVPGTLGAKASGLVPGGKRLAPLLSWSAAGTLQDLSFVDEAYDYTGVETSVNDPKAFALEIRGDSMSPEIKQGDYAIVAPSKRPELSGPVIVRTLHGEVLCKYFQTKDGGKLVILSSVNKSYAPIEIPASEIAWIYPVKQVIKNY